MHRRKLGILGVIGLTAVLLLGLSAGTGSARPTKGHKIFFLPKLIGVNVFTENGKGAKEAAAKLGDSVTYNGPTEAVAAKQVPFIDAAARQGYNAIVISANDPNAVAPALKRAAQRGRHPRHIGRDICHSRDAPLPICGGARGRGNLFRLCRVVRDAWACPGGPAVSS